MKLFGFFSRLDVGAAGQDNLGIGTTVPLGKFALRASYTTMSGKDGIAGRDAKMLALGGVYTMCRRTALYGNFSKISNTNTNTNFTVASGTALARGNDSAGYDLGLRHSF